MAKPKMTKWRLTSEQPPPCVGWWNASQFRWQEPRRWWNGRQWSKPVYLGDPDHVAETMRDVTLDESRNAHVEWRGLAEPPKDAQREG